MFFSNPVLSQLRDQWCSTIYSSCLRIWAQIVLRDLTTHQPAQYVPYTTISTLYLQLANLAHSSGGTFAPLSQVHVTSVIHQLLQGTGVSQSHYSSHSFRIGAATNAAVAGLPGRAMRVRLMFSSRPPAVPSILASTDANAQPLMIPPSQPLMTFQVTINHNSGICV